MKRILLSIAILSAVSMAFVQCGKNKISEEACKPVIEQMMSNLTANAKEEEKETAEKMQAMMLPKLVEECTKGKYDLECLKSAKTLAAIPACKK